MAWYDTLSDSQIKTLATQAVADNSVTYSEMLALLNAVAAGGVTSTEFADLKIVYTNSQSIYSNPYVAAISYNTIHGNSANAKWWGGVKQLDQYQAVGNMASGMSEANAKLLINEWFLGLDLPAPVSGGDTANPNSKSAVYNYGKLTGSLFVNNVAANDVAQGSAGTCYLIAAMGAVANSKPSYILNAFTDNGNGTYGVKFYLNGSNAYTTVDKQIPVTSYGTIAYAGNPTKSLSGEAWVPLFEKAYIQLNGQAHINPFEHPSDPYSGEVSYKALEGGWANPLKQITGLNYAYYSSTNKGSPQDPFSSGSYKADTAATYKQTIINALNSGEVGWLASFGATSVGGKSQFVSGHAFMILGYNSATDSFTIRNPWGEGGSNYTGQFSAKIEDFWNFSFIAITQSGTSTPEYSYTLSSSAGSSGAAVAEGSAIYVTVTRSSSGVASTVYLSTQAQTAGAQDYSALNKIAVSFGANETTKTVKIDTYFDTLTEGSENFDIVLFKQTTDTVAAATTKAYIKDTVAQEATYTITSSAASGAAAVEEGSNVTFTITRSSTGSASTVYLSTQTDTAVSADFQGLSNYALTFNAYETSKTITVKTWQDSIEESSEKFKLNLFKSPGQTNADASADASADGWVQDKTNATFTYDITNAASSVANAVSEGDKVIFTITRSGSGAASTIYASTASGTAGAADYNILSKVPVIFAANQKVATVEVQTAQDWWLDPTEYFYLNLYLNTADNSWVSSSAAYVKDKAFSGYSYTMTSNSNSANPTTEGDDVTFTITRSSSGTASTVYVSTSAVTAGTSDYQLLNKLEVNFAANETVKTVKVNSLTDALVEGTEAFELRLFYNEGDQVEATTATGYIKDAILADYTYTVSSSAENSSAAATEGGQITFTIARNTSGSASTVYVSTIAGSANSADYQVLDKVAVNFAAYETSKTITVTTNTDNFTEGAEYFWLNLYETYADALSANYATYSVAYLKDASITDYGYTLATNAGSQTSAMSEGGQITFTITRSGSGSASTVYVATTTGTAGSSDYQSLDKVAVNFGANEVTKTVTVNTNTDALTEGTEYFWLDLYKNYADAQIGNSTTYTAAYIKDASVTNYTYSVSNPASNSASAVTEGSQITFTVTRNASGSASTVYVCTQAGTAGTNDFQSFDKVAVNFAANETSKTITINTNTDSSTEGTEYFWLTLFKTYAEALSGAYSAYSTAYLKDAVVADYNYSISSSAGTSSAAIAEGGEITFTITRGTSGSASTVYVSTVGSSAGASDYQSIDKLAVNFASYETTKTVTVKTNTDSLTESAEFFWLDLYKTYADALVSNYSTYSAGYIKDAATTAYTYTLASTAGTSGLAVAEGGQITFTVTRSASGSASTVYVSTIANSAGSSDYQGLDKVAVSFGANDVTKTFTVSTNTDNLTEGEENFWVELYTAYADALVSNYATYTEAYIKDAATSSFNYSITSSAGTSAGAVAEGGSVTFTVTRSATGSASTVYVSTILGTTGSADHQSLDKMAINFGASETTKTITVNTNTDMATEGTEYFWLTLYKTYADALSGSYAAYGTGFIKDAASTNYSYTLANSASTSATAVAEGSPITYTVTRSGSGSASTVYVSTIGNTAGSLDFQALDKVAISFAANETVKTFTINTITDSTTESIEYFYVDLYKTYADALVQNYAAFSTSYVKDAGVVDYSYSMSNTASNSGAAATEGSQITYTITRSSSGTASTIYLSTAAGSAGSTDYQSVDKQAISFGASETSKTVTISTTADSLTEGTEYFWLNLYKTYADALSGTYATYSTGYIKDPVTTDYTYSLTSNATVSSPMTEGSPITFTLTRSGSGSASTVYVSSIAGTATSSDYQGLDKFAISFTASETVKTFTINTTADSLIENSEYFWVDVYKTQADALAANETTYTTSYIKDAPSYTYTITTPSSYTATAEGSSCNFTVTRSGSGSASTVYLSTIAGTATSSDYSALNKFAVNFTSSETSKTISVATVSDGLSEGYEYFFVDLYKSLSDAAAGAYSAYTYAYIKDPGLAAVADSLSTGVNATSVTLSKYDLKSYPGHYSGWYENDHAFAVILNDGSVVTLGDGNNGGDSSAVSGQLTNVVQVTPNCFAFAALRSDGSVVTWGNGNFGGNSAAVSSKLNGSIDVTDIYSTFGAFAALRADGSVVTWGHSENGGDSSAVTSALDGTIDVVNIYSNLSSFAAVRADGSVVTWGYGAFGGNSSSVASQLNGTIDAVRIFSTGSAFAALRADGSVITWGNSTDGGNSSAVSTSIDASRNKVLTIASTSSAFAALLADGSVATWGDTNCGGNSSAVSSALAGTIDVISIASTNTAFAALRNDGSVVTWGSSTDGGNSSAVASQLNGTIDVTRIFGNDHAFAALRVDGSVVTWGLPNYGGDSSAVASQLNGTIDVIDIAVIDQSFAALRADGSVVSWGAALSGGDQSVVATALNGTSDILALTGNGSAFLALNENGSVYTWGDITKGGQLSAEAGDFFAVEISEGKIGSTTVVGSSQNDQLIGTTGADTLWSGNGDDLLRGGAGNDVLIGGAGSDTADLSDATAAIVASISTGVVVGGAGKDRIYSIENLVGGAFNDTLTGSAGANVLEGGAGNDVINGGDGTDTASYARATSAVTVSLALTTVQNTVGAGSDTLTSIENLTGSAYADVLTGNVNANRIEGGAGIDRITGGAGADVLLGQDGDDIFMVLAAADFASGETITGGDGTDELRFAATAAGTLTLTLNVTVEKIVIGTGLASAAVLTGASALNVNAAAVGNAVSMTGNGGANILTGSAFDDTLNGGAGLDTLNGGGGNDLINGGLGNDTMSGGAGADIFVFNTAFGTQNLDTIQDFSAIDDIIHLENDHFKALLTPGTLASGAFVSGTKALDSDDRIIYESSTGRLLYDADGSGSTAAIQFAKIQSGLTLTNADFLVI
jgi:Ca2+-binding RTX toxin-like protein